MSDKVESAIPVVEPKPRPATAGRWRLRLVQALVFMFVIGLTVAIYSFRQQAPELARYGYPGIFLLALLSNATIILPAPGLALVFTFGGVFSPLGVGLAAAAGAALGELSGYVAGYSGQAIVERPHLYNRFEAWMKRYGPPMIGVMALIPSPFFDLAGIAAGVLRMPVHVFLFWCFWGQLGKMLVFAYAGAYSIDWLMRLVS